MKTTKYSLVTVVILILACSSVNAGGWQTKLSLKAAASAYIPASGSVSEGLNAGGLFKIGAGYGVINKLFLEGSISGGALSTPELGNPEIVVVNLNAAYLLFHGASQRLYITGGAGYFAAPGFNPDNVPSSASIDLGFRYSIPAGFNLLGFNYDFYIELTDHFLLEEDSFTPYWDKGRYNLVELSLGINYFFRASSPRPPKPLPGQELFSEESEYKEAVSIEPAAVEAPPSTDSDDDGVPDYKDRSPNTPSGVAVDADGRPLDADSDGVPDYIDLSPNTPYSIKVDPRGRPLDTDKDGIPNFRDLESNTLEGAPVDEHGRMKDMDKDGIPDNQDKDNKTPFGTAVKDDGTPILKVPQGVLKSVQFRAGSFVLLDESKAELVRLAEALRVNPKVVIELRGYTDSSGGGQQNLEISSARTQTVKNFLIQQGIAPERINAVGLGAVDFINRSNPQAPENRRIEVGILKK